MIYSEAVATGLPPSALLRAQYLCAQLPGAMGKLAWVGFVMHSSIRRWSAQGFLPDDSLLVESVRQTRKGIKLAAAVFDVSTFSRIRSRLVAHSSDREQDVRAMPIARSVLFSQTLLRLEAAPDWVEIALERVPHTKDELSLEELEWLASAMRQAGCEWFVT